MATATACAAPTEEEAALRATRPAEPSQMRTAMTTAKKGARIHAAVACTDTSTADSSAARPVRSATAALRRKAARGGGDGAAGVEALDPREVDAFFGPLPSLAQVPHSVLELLPPLLDGEADAAAVEATAAGGAGVSVRSLGLRETEDPGVLASQRPAKAAVARAVPGADGRPSAAGVVAATAATASVGSRSVLATSPAAAAAAAMPMMEPWAAEWWRSEEVDGRGGDDEEGVEVWEGDLGGMTADEEAALLAEAEAEIAKLERRRQAHLAAAAAAGRRLESEHLVMDDDEDEDMDVEDGEEPLEDDEDPVAGARLAPAHVAEPREPRLPAAARAPWQPAEEAGPSGHRDVNGKAEVGQEEEGDLGQAKERGLPAVMRCFDRAKVYVKAGDGGDGVVAFRREKYVPHGGPAGGSGGHGGAVLFEADAGLTSLLPFRRRVHFRATRGSHGQGSSCHGAGGEDVIVQVPPGTVVRECRPDGREGLMLELVAAGQREIFLPGGRGGRGNAAFKTGRNKTPQLSEHGEAGTEMWVDLELKLVADVGIVGVPNAGKSTLLAAVSAARPKVADYPFTTLVPNLGVVASPHDSFRTMVFADVPGLLEGAHLGVGLGQEFLRHTERCRVLVHVIDGTSPQPIHDYNAICTELELFRSALADKPQVVAFNKTDVPAAAAAWPAFATAMHARGVPALSMSAATGVGTQEVVRAAEKLLDDTLKGNASATVLANDVSRAITKGESTPSVGALVSQRLAARIEDFTVEVDRRVRVFNVLGEGLERFTQMTNWEYYEAVRRYAHVLEASGVNAVLREEGIREGDTVVIGKMEFDWRDENDFRGLGDWKRGTRGTKVWPH
eukprot:SM000132S26858  [mRNA]  locus=s132:6166:9283:- [translate_table: standard]